MNGNGKNIGVFLCQCGDRIAPLVDLEQLKDRLAADGPAVHVEIAPYPCLRPGLEAVRQAIGEHGLDRLVVAGCEARLMLKKFERELAEAGLDEGSIDMVNLRGHVAQVHDLPPEELADKGYKLIQASVAGLEALESSPKEKVDWQGPVMILGGGVATYAAAQELSRREIPCIIAVNTDYWEDELRMLHEHYPGERHYYDRLEAMLREVDESPHVRRLTVGTLKSLTGRTGNFQLTFTDLESDLPLRHQASAIIACLDGQMLNQGTDFGHDGRRVLCHTEAEEMLWTLGIPEGEVVFWINDYEADQGDYAYLSARAAWSMAKYMRERSAVTKVTMLYNHQMPLPLSAGERKASRELEIEWVPYDGAYRPTVQAGYVTFCRPDSHCEEELAWERLILSPRRSVGLEVTQVAQVLGLQVQKGQFLEQEHKHAKVRPEQQGREEAFLAGSARYPCDLHEALRQGRRAAAKTAELAEQARAGELYAPRMVCTVDQDKCIGCGLCKEICDCGGIEPVEGPGGNIPRHVDPLVCTGGGTCAAACPYHALNLQNNTTGQREARVATLARLLAPGEFISFGCAWGGLAAADNAGVKGLKYSPQMQMLRVGCIGQLDPRVMARAFLEGSPGLLLIGCPPEECHHSYGLDHTWSRVNLIKKLLSEAGFQRERIALAHADLNAPEEYLQTVEAFTRIMAELGPIERDAENLAKLQGIYDTVNNSRVRWVVGAALRRPWEEVYPGNQRHALAFDQDLVQIVGEEYVRERVKRVLHERKEPVLLTDLAGLLRVDQRRVRESLSEMVAEGLIGRMHKEGMPMYVAS
jgi:heterodisulfide reductase subunit A-like polyferredoxin/coenzyme F420-reducing hydrogenase delta subunit